MPSPAFSGKKTEEEKPMVCPNCGRSYKRESGLKLHRQFDCYFHQCPRCQRRLANQKELKAHEALCNGKTKKELICINCKNVFPSVKILRRHILTECGKSEVNCPYCRYKTKKRSKLLRHLWKKHPDSMELQDMQPKKEINENLDKNLPFMKTFSKKASKLEREPPDVIPIGLLYPEVSVNQMHK